MDNKKNILSPNTVLNGKAYQYRIIKDLGQGTFGITYLATTKFVVKGALGNIETEINVAIKEFFMRDINGRSDATVTSGSKGGIYDDYKKKFIREALNLSRLQHPNIIKVIESFEANNTVYYVMEYISGGSLDDYILKNHGLKADEAIRIVKQIGSALTYMHDQGMLHLDLKPSNIMMKDSGEAVLIDFGLSKQYDESGKPESSTKVGAGTPGYAPIEQANYREGKDFPVTMDVYALGATMFKILTGRRAPEASDILNDGFPVYELHDYGIHDNLVAIISKAMSPTKKERYQTIAELVGDCANTSFNASNENEQKFGDYKNNARKVECETEEAVNVEINDLLPIPDYSIKIVMKNPTPGSLSYEFYLSAVCCNTVFIYRNGKKILDEDYYGGIRPEVIDALKQNGFFSKVHWEKESSTAPLTGFYVECSFYYQNREPFVRVVKLANPTYRHLLLDAVQNVLRVEELSKWINMALDGEHSYSKEFIEEYGISMFSFVPDGRFLIYYRGKTYNGDEINIDKFQLLANTASFLDDARFFLHKIDNSINLDTYINSNKKTISTAYNIITYCSEHDFLNIQRTIKKKPFVFGTYRVVQEMQLIPLCFDAFKDAHYSYEYQYQYCEAEFGGGLVEILQSGFIDKKENYYEDAIVKKLSNFEGFAYLTLGAIIQYHIWNKKYQEDTVLLSAMPFDMKAEIWINGRYRDGFSLINTDICLPNIPSKVSETIYDDNCSIVIVFLGKRFSLNVYDLFGYNPKAIEFTVDIDAKTNMKFILEDKKMGKKLSLSFTDLLSYEIENISEDTI